MIKRGTTLSLMLISFVGKPNITVRICDKLTPTPIDRFIMKTDNGVNPLQVCASY